MTRQSDIRGATLIVDLMQMYPNGEAIELMSRLGWACAHCGARSHEPLALAAKRHGNPVRPVITCFRALAAGGPTVDEVCAARPRPRLSPDPMSAWLRSAAR
ncbi:MAG: hypothetical protein ACR2PG_22285 [Hyphomicrobiaceae bacterium]